VGENGQLRCVLEMSAMVKQDNFAAMRDGGSKSFAQKGQLMNAQIIGDLRNNDEIERTTRHLTRKFCLDKPNVSAVHPLSRFGKGCWRSVERHQPQA
jgi:hypothetical protein